MVASTVMNEENRGLDSIQQDQVLDLLDSSCIATPSEAPSCTTSSHSLLSAVEGVPSQDLPQAEESRMMDEIDDQYEEAFALQNFLKWFQSPR